MADEAGKEAARPVTDEELGVAFSGPAMAANRVFVTFGAGGVRIAFTEQQGSMTPFFRTAVIMPFQDAINLKNVLISLLKDVEKQIADAKAAAETDG